MFVHPSPLPALYLSAFRFLRRASTAQNYYQILELPPHASLKDIKTQFKKLLKKYHPDVNAHLPEEEKDLNSARYVQMVLAYATLKDARKKREYDASIGGKTHGAHNSRETEWNNRYYGEAKYYSRGKASATYTSQGYNARRHRVHNFHDSENNSHFSGKHVNYGDRFDVPHFDYNEHLSKHLKFEQRIINKQLSDEDREAILRQLAKDGDVSNVSEELITKHLMRLAQRTKLSRNEALAHSTAAQDPHMYQGPQNGGHHEERSVGVKTVLVLGGAGVYLLYQALAG